MTYDGPRDFPVLELGDVHDGDTFWLRIDQGVRNSRMLNIRLDGWDCPEIEKPSGRPWSAYEKAHAVEARARTLAWLSDALQRKALKVHTEQDPTTYDRWVGDVYRTDSETGLGDWLYGLGLAVPWHRSGDPKWYQVHAAEISAAG